MYQNDRDNLKNFMRNTYAWLDDCYLQKNDSDWPKVELLVAFRGFGKEAWIELTQSTPCEKICSELDEVADKKLEDSGLIGSQLAYKLSLLEYYIQTCKEKITGRMLKKMIEVIKSVIGSILAALNAHEGIAEIIDMLNIQMYVKYFRSISPNV